MLQSDGKNGLWTILWLTWRATAGCQLPATCGGEGRDPHLTSSFLAQTRLSLTSLFTYGH